MSDSSSGENSDSKYVFQIQLVLLHFYYFCEKKTRGFLADMLITKVFIKFK